MITDKNEKCDNIGVGLFKKSEKKDRLVGIAYSTWHRKSLDWNERTWNVPLINPYDSTDRDAVYQHGIWFAEADIDFVFVDWSNNTEYDPLTMSSPDSDFTMIETATDVLFEVWAEILNAPKICIFVGPGHSGVENVKNGNHQKKVNQVYKNYIENTKYNEMYFYYEGKPLLMCYGATPTLYGADPEWKDDRFTIRWVTGYVGQQKELFDEKTLQSKRYWSWEERGAQTYTVSGETVEAVTCSAATRPQNAEEDREYIPPCMRNEGATLKRQFQRAINLGAKIILLVSWNEWVCSEQISVEQSKDLEPSKIHGTFYYDIMKKEIKKFKRKK